MATGSRFELPQVLHLLLETFDMQPDAPLKIFIIYAHEDRGFKEGLLKRLKLLRSQGLIAPWHDRDLVAGDDWDKVIRGHLAVADIILPIISIDFFNSDYIEQVEIVEAFERYEQGKAHIIPIIARQCLWEDDPRIAKLQALPENGLPIAKWASADEAFDSVYDGIKAKIVEIQNGLVQAQALKTNEKTFPLLPVMISVKGGTFRLGDHVECTLSDFAMGKYAVTFGEYDRYCEAMKIEKPSDEGWGRGKRPVINVSWFDAVAYCNWLSEINGLKQAYGIEKETVSRIAGSNGLRLPTEAEWEFAARGGTLSKGYEYAGSNNLGEVGWYWKNSERKTHPVGEKKANELGFHDMSGNVWEWCWDYPSLKQADTQNVYSDSLRVLHGCSWSHDHYTNPLSRWCSSYPNDRCNVFGFRCAQNH
ncbi:MAG: SUMF1/EgtB/PvdO family nonheme iron enzyme [Phycisphaerae bacterium]|nr:SUMF1/EgtB/PvdO family nonheme iron enzyme [Saprospiraceae bacterium]